jgi:hypothetical protein
MVNAASHMALASVEATVDIEPAIVVMPSPAETRRMLRRSLPVVDTPALLGRLQTVGWIVFCVTSTTDVCLT